MKTLFVLVCMFAICTLGMAQERNPYPNLKPGVLYVFNSSQGQMLIEGLHPEVDPYAISEINPAFLTPIDGAGPIAMDPTEIRRMNPNHLFILDGACTGQSAWRTRTANTIDKTSPANTNPLRSRTSNPSWANNWD